MNMLVGLLQSGPETAEAMAGISTALTVIAVMAVVIAVGFVGIVVASLAVLRSVSRAARVVEQQVHRLGPRAEPLLDNVNRLAIDARGVSGDVRRGVADLMSTIDDLNRSLREAGEGGKSRVREFTAVLDVIRGEAEEILLDSAATARGIHATAEALRGAKAAVKRGGSTRSLERADEEAIP